MEPQARASDDFQEIGSEERAFRRKFNMDAPMENKICELYDLYVDVITCPILTFDKIHLGKILFVMDLILAFLSFYFLQGLDEDAGPQIRKFYVEVGHLSILSVLSKLP